MNDVSLSLQAQIDELHRALTVSEGIRQQLEQYVQHKRECKSRTVVNRTPHHEWPCDCGLVDLQKEIQIQRNQSRIDGFPKPPQKSDLRDGQRGAPSDG
jgi:hypothetical protein